MNLRSPNGKDMRPMSEYEGLQNLNYLSQRAYDSIHLLTYLVGRSGSPKDNFGLNGIFSAYFRNAEHDITHLQNLGLLEIRETDDWLSLLPSAILSKILSSASIAPIPKTKNAMINLIKKNGETLKAQLDDYSHVRFRCIPTETGWKMIKSLYNEYFGVIDNLKCEITEDRYGMAAQLWVDYDERQKIFPKMDMSIGTSRRSKEKAVEDLEQKITEMCFGKEKNDALLAAALSMITGSPVSDFCDPDALEEARAVSKEKELLSRYELHKGSTHRDLKGYTEAGITVYRFLASLDANTCMLCGRLDGQLFKVREAVFGVNCPPMHLGCRCTTVAGDVDVSSLERWARNPVTNMSYRVPYMRYPEWFISLPEEEKEAVKKKQVMDKLATPPTR